MSRKNDNFGPGGFSDQFDNHKFRSVDRDQNPGGVTGVPFEDDDYHVTDTSFSPHNGEAYYYPGKRSEPSRDADLGLGRSGTNWNRGISNYYGLGPKGWKLSDERLYEKVCDVLLKSHEVDASEIDVEVKEGVVNMKGYISSLGMKRVAEDLVGSIPGVVDVFTQLKIHNTSNFQLSEKALRESRETDLS